MKPHMKKQKVKRAPFSVYAVAGIIILFTFVYLFNMTRARMTPVIPTEVVRMGSVGTPQTFTGVIIRDERVYTAPRDGQLIFAVGEFERVRAGTIVASIQNSAEMENINRDMMALEQRGLDIGELRAAQDDPNVIRINAHIHDQVDNRAHSFTSLNFSELYSLRDNLNHSINSRNQFIINGSIQAGGDYARQQEELITRMGVHSTNMVAHSGGIMTSVLDGLENVFLLSNMSNLTREQINFTPDPLPLIPAQHLYANDPAFKIVGNIWYMAAYISNDLLTNFAVGQMRNIYVESPATGEFTPMNVQVHQLTQGTRESRVVFRNTRYVIDFMHMRNVNIRVTQRMDVGLVIPNTAITTREYIVMPLNFLHGLVDYSVLRYTGEGSERIPITVSEWMGTQIYVTGNLRVGDVILDGLGGRHTISEVRTTQGVYWAHTGFASFRRIFTDEIITERGGVTVLCPRQNPRLREFYTIVVDAATVREGEVIWGR